MSDSPIARSTVAFLLLLAAVESAARPEPAASAPDLEIVALQTTGPGRIGDCNAVVARVHNAGARATTLPPAVRLDVSGSALWTRTARAATTLAPGDTVEVWFENVPLEGGRLSQLEVTADPDGRESESIETNNTRRVPRDPQLACGAPEPAPAAGLELRVTVTRRDPAGSAEPSPIEAAEITVTSPLGVGVVLANGTTAAGGVAVLSVPADSRSPVLKVTAATPGCPPGVNLATPVPGSTTPLEVTIEITCAAGGSATSAVDEQGGRLEIETALPGRLRLDEGLPKTVSFGSRVTVKRPGADVRVRVQSANGTSFYDAVLAVPPDTPLQVTIDAPPLRAMPRTGATGSDPEVVEDLRSGLLWTAGAATAASFEQAAAICDGIDRGGATDWRLPEIDELAFVLATAGASSSKDAGTGAPLRSISDCCLWSSTEHAGLRLTFYLDGGHIYGRRAEEGGVGALCVRGGAYEVDPLLVPDRYHDRLPGLRRFRPRD